MKIRVARTILACALVACVLTGCSRTPGYSASYDSIRTIEQGKIVGALGVYGNHAWRGIPYARKPIGPLRWRAPEYPESWSGTRETLHHGNFCPQFASPFGGVPGDPDEVVGSEDCLYLDVYAPRMKGDTVPTGNARLPVMFWIHGGGNVIGHSGFYDGGRLAQTQQVIVVAINYRLGPLGWFRHASLRDGDTGADDRSGNFGTLDMIRALEWVRGNIAAFGGDPSRVTIFGESAGGTDVFALLLAPGAKGLFHRAIAQSGGTHFADPIAAENFVDASTPGDPGSSNELLVSLLLADRIETDRRRAKERLAAMSTVEIAGYLRSRSPSELLRGYTIEGDEAMIDLPLLFRDGSVLPSGDPLDHLTTADGWNVVPVIVGTNRDENKLFLFGNPKWVKNWFGLIPRFRDQPGFELQAKYQSLMWRASGSDEPAAAMRRVSDAVWSYRFDWDEEPSIFGSDFSAMLGASHGFEIPFVFGHFDLGPEGNAMFTDQNRWGREALSASMMSYWSEFARGGDPGRGREADLPRWNRWNSPDDAEKFIVFDTPTDGGIRMSAGSVTTQRIGQLIAADDELLERDDRCEIIREVARWSSWPGLPECNEPEISASAAAAG